MSEFHAKDGWFFLKHDDEGAVRIVQREQALPDAAVVVQEVFPASMWNDMVAGLGEEPIALESWFFSQDPETKQVRITHRMRPTGDEIEQGADPFGGTVLAEIVVEEATWESILKHLE